MLGEVVAVGLGKKDDNGDRLPLDVVVGDRVLYGKYSGNDIRIDGVDYLIIKEEDVLAVQ